MAKLDSISIMVALLLAAAAMVSPSLGEDVLKEAKEGLAPQPSPGYYNFLNECVKQLTAECGKEVYLHVFRNWTTITPDCCKDFVIMGYPCHVALVKQLLAYPEFKPDAPKYLARAEVTWDTCVSVEADAEGPIPSGFDAEGA